MNKLLWTCSNGTEFSTTEFGYHLTVRRARLAAGFEFQIAAEPAQIIASGFHRDLRDTFGAAERTLASILDDRRAHNKLMVA